jgi:hypothetical protein
MWAGRQVRFKIVLNKFKFDNCNVQVGELNISSIKLNMFMYHSISNSFLSWLCNPTILTIKKESKDKQITSIHIIQNTNIKD